MKRPLRWDARHSSLQRSQELLVLRGCADGDAEGIGRSPRSTHVTNDDAVVLQNPAKAGRIFANPAEEEVRPRRSYVNRHVRGGGDQQLCFGGIRLHRSLNVGIHVTPTWTNFL